MSVPSRNGLTKPKRVRGSGVKMVNMGELFANQRIQNLEMDRVPLVEKERIALLEPNDLLFARQSLVFEGAGQCSIFLGDDEDVCFESHLIRVRIDPVKADPRYIFYWLLSPAGKNAISSKVEQGAGAAGIRGSDLQKVKIELPDLEAQKKIADILGTIDEKIELNRQMNETLEQMGQALFRHYFIDNPEAEKWEKRELGEFFPIKTGKKDANFGTEDGEYPFFTCAQTISKAPDFSFDAHALLLAGNGDFNLKLYRGKFEAYQRTYVLIPDDERFVGILYFLMKMKLPEITGGSRGSVIKFITKGMIENYKFALPNDSELAEMSEVFNQITINIEENVKEIQTLTTLRDTLLPQLISGKVKV